MTCGARDCLHHSVTSHPLADSESDAVYAGSLTEMMGGMRGREGGWKGGEGGIKESHEPRSSDVLNFR